MGLSDFKPLAFGLLAGDNPKDALKNAFGVLPGAKAYFDDEEDKKKAEEAATAAASTAATGEAPGNAINKKKGGSIKASASRRADGIAQRGKTRGKMY